MIGSTPSIHPLGGSPESDAITVLVVCCFFLMALIPSALLIFDSVRNK